MTRRLVALCALFALGMLSGCADRETQSAADTPPATTAKQPDTVPVFTDAGESTGLRFAHFAGSTGEFLFAEILGSGVALFDYDNDSDLDVFLVQADLLDQSKSLADAVSRLPEGQPPGHRLFKNTLIEDGTLGFVDVTDAAGLTHVAYGMGAVTGDIDNDGDLDLYVTQFGSNVLYRNNGDGTFSDITAEANADAPNWSTSASFFDLENDGDLDLYVTAYVEYRVDIDVVCNNANGARDYCGPQNYQGARDYLLRNDGAGVFEDVSDQYGVGAVRGPGLGVVAADFNGDGWSDLFVANDGKANFFWLNDGGARFEETGLMSGTAYNRDGSPEASMGVSAGDFDGDGDDDLFMTHLNNETNTLYVNDGDGNFFDTTDRAGLGAGSKIYTGFGTAWFDPDNDGWLDLYVVNGAVKIEEQSAVNPGYAQNNQLFLNRGGTGFIVWQPTEDPATGPTEISRGVAFGDIDRDGDTDMVVTNNNGPAKLLLNQTESGHAWLGVHLEGTDSPRDADGSRIKFVDDQGTVRWRRVQADGSYLSASDREVLVGLGKASSVTSIAVVWTSGRSEQWAGPFAGGQRVRLVEGTGEPWPDARGAAR